MKKKVTCLGAGAWGYCLANLLAKNGHDVTVWAKDPTLIETLQNHKQHPKFPGLQVSKHLTFEKDLKKATQGAEFIVESVTTKGLRPVLTKLLEWGPLSCPLILTSKGIEQKTGNLLPEMVFELCGESAKDLVVCLTGPSLADEVMQELPTSVVAAGYNKEARESVAQIFNSPYFRVYPNEDLIGAAFGGAMKNIYAIACGISDGLEYGQNTKAALMTRGLHEMRKLSSVKGAKDHTLSGLAGLGDLTVTCLSDLSRNYRFGKLIGEGVPVEGAQKKIKMVVEGANTCVSALELGKKAGIPMPITEAVHAIIYDKLDPNVAVRALLARVVKEEHL